MDMKMHFKRCSKNAIVSAILGFVTGLLMAFFLPPVVIAVLECILIIVLCVCIKR